MSNPCLANFHTQSPICIPVQLPIDEPVKSQDREPCHRYKPTSQNKSFPQPRLITSPRRIRGRKTGPLFDLLKHAPAFLFTKEEYSTKYTAWCCFKTLLYTHFVSLILQNSSFITLLKSMLFMSQKYLQIFER